MNVVDINSSNRLKSFIEKLKIDCEDLFNKVDESGEIYIINNFPAVTDKLGKISLLFLVNIPYKYGSYYCFYRDDEQRKYLNSLAFGINFVTDQTMIDIDENNYISEEGLFPYKDELENESVKFNNWVYQTFNESHTFNPFFRCVFFDWIRADNLKKQFENEYVIVNKKLSIRNIINVACRRVFAENNCAKLKGCSSFTLKENMNLSKWVQILIEKANEETTLGILTKKKVDLISRPTKTVKRINESQGVKLCLIKGKAGSGKTLALMQILYEIVSQNKHARLLTYNNLLTIDIKQFLRNMENIRSSNASIGTLHKFFYRLSKNMRVQALLTWDRIEEVVTICKQRIDIGEQIIEYYLQSHEKLPDIESYDSYETIIKEAIDNYAIKIETSDRYEVKRYLEYVLRYPELTKENRTSQYLIDQRNSIEQDLGHKVFITDYNKVLETMYLMLDKTEDFYEKFHIKDRHDFLAIIKETDIVKKEITQEYSVDDLTKFIEKVTRTSKWSNSILIDEGQDCNIYEKLIIMKLRGAENLIVASGGKDQLIRKANEIDWHVAAGTPIPYEDIKLGRKTYRQKGNIVKFVNEFYGYYFKSESESESESLEPLQELDKTGNVIIDLRNSFPLDIIEEQRKRGEIMGCSPYESMMFLVPGIGFTTKTMYKSRTIDEDDNIKSTEHSKNRHLVLPEIPNVNIWNGTVESKGQLSLPSQDQTRCLYFDSCRGLEAWSVFCLNLDLFFYIRKNSDESERYAIEQNELFTDKDILKRNYALLWCNMVFTRAIDTLYIRVENPLSEFSKNLIYIAERCGDAVQILT